MDTRKQAEVLAQLHFLDQAEVAAIDAALPKVGGDVAVELEHARADHQRHLRELDALFGECGEVSPHPTVPESMQDAARRRIDAVHAAEDEQGALRALLTSERVDVDAYRRAGMAQLPAGEGPAMQAHLGDERRHVEALEQRLRG